MCQAGISGSARCLSPSVIGVVFFPLRWGEAASDSGVALVFYFISHCLMLVTERNLFNHEWAGAKRQIN